MNRCFVCQQCEESVDHLLLHCSKMRVLWELHVEGVSYFFLYSILGATLAPSNIYFSLLIKKKKKTYGVGICCILGEDIPSLLGFL